MAYLPKETAFKADKSSQRALRMSYYASRKWKMLRKKKMMNCPLCEKCLSRDVITPAIDTHHIISPFQFEDKYMIDLYMYDSDNLMSLCKRCHADEHKHNKD